MLSRKMIIALLGEIHPFPHLITFIPGAHHLSLAPNWVIYARPTSFIFQLYKDCHRSASLEFN